MTKTMAKSNGGTRAGNGGNPRGLSSGGAISRTENQNGVVNSRNDNEEIAERLYSNGLLKVDPGDATFELARNLNANSIEDSIENCTEEYTAQVNGNNIDVWAITLERGEAMRNWGKDDKVSIPMENRSLMDIIMELRTSNVSKIYQKYGN